MYLHSQAFVQEQEQETLQEALWNMQQFSTNPHYNHPHHHPGHHLPHHGFPLWPPPWPVHLGHFHHPPHLQPHHGLLMHAPGPPPPWLWGFLQHPGHVHHPHHHPVHHNGFAFFPHAPPFPWVEAEIDHASQHDLWSDPHFRYLDPDGLDEDPTLDDPELIDERDFEDNPDLVTARARLDDKFW